MFVAHWREIAHYPDILLDVDVAAYCAAEDAGGLRCYTAREDGVLIGYCVFFLRYNMHYRRSYQALQDVLFAEEHRRGRVGLALIRFSERELEDEGVQVVYHHVKAGREIRAVLAQMQGRHDVGRLMELMHYELIDLIYGKRLDGRVA